MYRYLKYLLETSSNNEELIEKLEQTDYYMILGLEKNASIAVIYDNFKEALEEFGPTFSLSENLEKNAIAYSFVLKAFSTLYNPATRKIYDKTIEELSNNKQIKFTEDKQGKINIEDEQLLTKLTTLLKIALTSTDEEASSKAKQEFVELTKKVQTSAAANYIMIHSQADSFDINKNSNTENLLNTSTPIFTQKNQDYQEFHDQDCIQVIIPTEEDADNDKNIDVITSTKKNTSISILQLFKENIKKLKPTNKKEFLNLFMSLILTLAISAGFYVETEKLKNEFSKLDYKKTLTNIQTMIEEMNKTVDLTINHEVTDSDTKFGLACNSQILLSQFDDVEDLEVGDNISFVYKIKECDLPECAKQVVLEPDADLGLKSLSKKYNTNIETLIHLNPEVFGSREIIGDYVIEHPSMFMLSENPGVINVPDIELIKHYDVENYVVYQKVKKEVY